MKKIVKVLIVAVFVLNVTAAHALMKEYNCWADVAGTNGGPGNWIFTQSSQYSQNQVMCNMQATCQTQACSSTVHCAETVNPPNGQSTFFNYNPPSNCTN